MTNNRRSNSGGASAQESHVALQGLIFIDGLAKSFLERIDLARKMPEQRVKSSEITRPIFLGAYRRRHR
jgi:hypothetical protein